MRKFTNLPEGAKCFSPTGLETYLACPRKYYYQKVLKLMPKSAEVNLIFGSAIHEGIAHYYLTRASGAGNLASTKECLIAFKLAWDAAGIQGNSKKNSATGIQLLTRYCETYKNDGEEFNPTLIEVAQPITMPNGTWLLAVIDRVKNPADYISIVDSKTSGWPLTDYYFAGLQNSFQFSAYDYIVTQIMGHCDAIQVDGLYVPYKDEKSLARRAWQLTSKQKEDWLNTYLRVTDSLLKCEKESDYYTNGGSCGEYGGCQFINLCRYGLSHPSVSIDFSKREEL